MNSTLDLILNNCIQRIEQTNAETKVQVSVIPFVEALAENRLPVNLDDKQSFSFFIVSGMMLSNSSEPSFTARVCAAIRDETDITTRRINVQEYKDKITEANEILVASIDLVFQASLEN